MLTRQLHRGMSVISQDPWLIRPLSRRSKDQPPPCGAAVGRRWLGLTQLPCGCWVVRGELWLSVCGRCWAGMTPSLPAW